MQGLFWGVEIRAELAGLRSYCDLMEGHLVALTTNPPDEISHAIAYETESDEYGPSMPPSLQAWLHISEAVAPRLARGTFLVALYATYEESVARIANGLQHRFQHSLKMKDRNGEFLKRANKYFTAVLNVQLCPNQEAWRRIDELAFMRHLFAHAGGSARAITENRKQLYKNLQDRNAVTEEWNYVIPAKEYTHELLRVVGATLSDLVERTSSRVLRPT